MKALYFFTGFISCELLVHLHDESFPLNTAAAWQKYSCQEIDLKLTVQ
jgi:hypothetical protein